MAAQTTELDVVVVGAGAVGLAVALGLARQNVRVGLFGPAETPRNDTRTVALMQPSLDFLDRIGAGARMEGRTFPLAGIRLIDITGALLRAPTVTFRASEIGLDAFAENIANSDLIGALSAALAETDARTDPSFVRTATFGVEHAHLVLEGGGQVDVRLVVAADGGMSPMRDAAGIGAQRWSYEQVALTFHVRHSRDHEDISTEFHTRAGPLTFVPFGDDTSSVVWLVTPEEAKQLRALSAQDLAAACQRRSSSLLGDLTLISGVGAVPMRGLIANSPTAPRLMLAGEALHVFPPVGAQGLNLGLRDAQGVVETVRTAIAAGHDPGGRDALAQYAQGRQLDATSRTFGVDLLNRSLIAGLLPLDLLRVAGLTAASSISPLRRMMMRAGMGQSPLAGRRPTASAQ